MKSRTGLVPSTPGVRTSFDPSNHRYVRSRQAAQGGKKRPTWNDRFSATVDPNASRFTAAELAARRVGLLSKHNILHRTDTFRANKSKKRGVRKRSGRSKDEKQPSHES